MCIPVFLKHSLKGAALKKHKTALERFLCFYALIVSIKIIDNLNSLKVNGYICFDITGCASLKLNREKLIKDKRIIQLVDHLENRFGFGRITINDFWNGDLCAIGLSVFHKQTLVYISTYGKKEGEYYISVEDIENPLLSIIKSENAEIKELEIIIAEYLK